MIIEIFGPQGAGKTTFARALSDRLQRQGHAVDLVLSYRPSERSQHGSPTNLPSHSRATAVASRLIRPLIELLTMTRHPLAHSYDVSTAATLLKALPPKNILSLIRLSQYILRLSRSWRLASEADLITLFDQAFVQAVCSLVLFSRSADEALISRALDAIPQPDLLIQLNAPQGILEDRLRDRQRLLSPMERLLEIDPETNIEGQRIFEQVQELLRKRGQAPICIASTDSRSLADAVNKIGEQIATELVIRQRQSVMLQDGLPEERFRHV
jgi:thymidylate kinase